MRIEIVTVADPSGIAPPSRRPLSPGDLRRAGQAKGVEVDPGFGLGGPAGGPA
ncbi:MAG: hypothetical protein H0U97_04400 [Gammaproteobacteria bacterium]|nr:hypothetical protein [Gammaproteobacteria bacterium]